MSKEIKAQVVVLGSGPAGYSAAFRCADLGLACQDLGAEWASCNKVNMTLVNQGEAVNSNFVRHGAGRGGLCF